MKADQGGHSAGIQSPPTGYSLVLQDESHAPLFPPSLGLGKWESIESSAVGDSVDDCNNATAADEIRLDGDRLSVLPTGIPETLSILVHCKNAESLAKWRSCADRVRIIFQPGVLALNDAERRSRLVLVAKGDLKLGHIIIEDDVEVTRGCDGLNADKLRLIVGMRLAQDVSSGTAIDFGAIL